MKRFSPSDAEALLSGRLVPDDASPELAELASLIEAARSPASARELAGEAHLVAAITAAVRGTVEIAPVPSERRPRVFGKALSTRVIALSTALLFSGGAVAAAATGALPASIQTTVAHGLAHLGISMPSPATHPPSVQSQHKDHSSDTRTAMPGKGVVAPGLCALYQHSNSESSAISTGTKASSSAFSRLAAAARAKGETIDEYCQLTAPLSTTSSTAPGSVHRPSTPVPSPAATSAPASPPANTPVGTTSSGTGTANAGTRRGGRPPKSLPTAQSVPARQGPPSTTPGSNAPSSGSSGSTAQSTTTPSTTPGSNAPSTTIPSTIPAGVAPGSGSSGSAAPSTTIPSTTPAGLTPGSGSSGSTAGTGVPVHAH